MRQLTFQAAILISVVLMCISGIAIAFISHDDCRAMHRPPPPITMQGGFEQGRGLGGRQMGPPPNRGERRNDRRGRRSADRPERR